MRLIRFGTWVLPNNDSESSLPVSLRSSLVELPYGGFDQDGGTAVIRTGDLSFRCNILVADGDIETTLNALLAEVAKGRRTVVAEMRDGSRRVTFAKATSVQRDASPARYDEVQAIALTLEQDYPYWLAETDGWYFDSGVLLDSGYSFDGNVDTFTLTGSPTTTTLTNDGGVTVPRGTIYIEPRPASGITDPEFTNAANDMSFKYTGTLAAGDILVVDCLTRTVTKNGVDVYASFSVGSATQTDWMNLEMGDNAITVTGTGISGTIDVSWVWQRHYL